MVVSKSSQHTEREPAIEIRALDAESWDVVETLFGSNGACGGCWCMWWRVERGGKTWEEAKGEKNRARMRRLVRAGAVDAVIAYVDGEPVGWCSFGPRESFPRLGNSRVLRRVATTGTWSIVCFYIPARWRGRGVATRLLAAATERAFERGAVEVEGFPVPVRGTGTMPAAFAWTGVPALFDAAGFVPLGPDARPRDLRPIYVRGGTARRTATRSARASPGRDGTRRRRPLTREAAEPMRPMKPLAPMEPLAPARPLRPGRAPGRVAPAKPMQPAEPMRPAKPMQPEKPMRPAKRLEPMKPLAPMKTIPPFERLPARKKTPRKKTPSKPQRPR